MRAPLAAPAAAVFQPAAPRRANVDPTLLVTMREAVYPTGGTPVTGDLDRVLRLFAGETGGAPLHEQTVAGVTVAQGLFEGGAVLWLETVVGEQALPRRLAGPVPDGCVGRSPSRSAPAPSRRRTPLPPPEPSSPDAWPHRPAAARALVHRPGGRGQEQPGGIIQNPARSLPAAPGRLVRGQRPRGKLSTSAWLPAADPAQARRGKNRTR